jgi:hypothetical protein
MVTARTAIRVTGVSSSTLYYWVSLGKLTAVEVEGVGTPRYDLDQLQALVRGEPPRPPGNGRRGVIELAEQLALALEEHNEEFLRLQAEMDSRALVALKALLDLVRTRLAPSGSSSSRYLTWRQAAQRWSRAA